jgi:hypothetical protein
MNKKELKSFLISEIKEWYTCSYSLDILTKVLADKIFRIIEDEVNKRIIEEKYIKARQKF